MSQFVGFVRWDDDRRLQRQDGERLIAAVAARGQARPALVSAPPFHAAFRQALVTPEDGFERSPAALGACISLFAGRIDDRDGLAGSLAVSVDGASDSVLALRAFHRWGEAASGAVVGEFAWAGWDGARRRLVLARDTSSARTLYLYRTERFVAFATGLRALFALPDVPREPDDVGLAEFLVLNPVIGERTVYRGVRQVVSGTTLAIDRDGLRRRDTWQPRPVAVPRNPLECADAAREVFGRALQARLRSLGTTAVLLSGGLDSAIIAAEAARFRSPDPVHAFVLVPRAGVPLSVRAWEEPDDHAQVEALAARYPNLHVTRIAPGADPLDADPTALFSETGLPVAFFPNLTWLLAGWRAARTAGARLMLTGDGGELSLTHDGSLGVVVRQGQPLHALREAWLAARHGRGRFLGHLDRAFLGSGLTRLRQRSQWSRPGDWRRYSALHPDLAASAGVRDRLLAEGFPGGWRHAALGQREMVERSLRWSAQLTINTAALRQLSGLEHSSPFHDRRVLEFCLSLPESMFVRDGWSRWLARTAFREALPAEVRERTVKAAQNADWFHRIGEHRAAYHVELERIATSPLASRVLDLARLKSLLDHWPDSVQAADAAGPAYRSTLMRGLQAGAFLRWLDASNRS